MDPLLLPATPHQGKTDDDDYIEKHGLPEVRQHRLNMLEKEQKDYLNELERKRNVFPQVKCLVIVRVEGE